MRDGQAHEDHDAPLSEINVTPLVDVMLVLLVIFIILAPLFVQSMRVDLPETAAELDAQTDQETADVVVHRDGRIALEGEPVSQATFREQLRSRLADRPQLVVRVGAHGDVAYREVADVLALLRDVGARRLAFAYRGAD